MGKYWEIPCKRHVRRDVQEFSGKFGKRTSKEDVFSEITPEPVAAASLGQAQVAENTSFSYCFFVAFRFW